jgi:hypothetical protein
VQRLRAVMPGGQTMSAGVATWDGEHPAERLLERADDALYPDKKGAPCGEARLLASIVGGGFVH